MIVDFPTQPNKVEPKQDGGRVGAHRYVLTYQPNAEPARRWLWRVYFSIEIQYHGYASSLAEGHRRARARINDLVEDRSVNIG